MDADDKIASIYSLSSDGSLQPVPESYVLVDVDDYESIQSDGIGRATKEVVRAALRTWACDGYKPQSDILEFLDQMRDEVSKGMIRGVEEDAMFWP